MSLHPGTFVVIIGKFIAEASRSDFDNPSLQEGEQPYPFFVNF